MSNKLKLHFPLIWEREELLREIEGRMELRELYQTWTPPRQKEFLDFCTGVRGIKLLYDSFFKEIMNPEYAQERMEELLSLLLGTNVKILAVLPTDSTRIAAESSLLIMDIVVQLENGSIVNLEVQKVGYKFPGSRSACYSADLLLRQYRRVRSQANTFSYKDIKGVYTIVLFESSPKEFKGFSESYLHYFQQQSDTGLELDLLQKYLFIPLDIFKKNQHNDDKNKTAAEKKRDAWLTFLSSDDPEDIIRLIEDYPEFKPLYMEAYEMCRNIEEVMHMFSSELAELDRNTVQLMIDEMQEEIVQQAAQLEKKDEQMKEQAVQLEAKDEQMKEQAVQLEAKDKQIQTIIRSTYSAVKDVKEVAVLLGVTVEEVEQAI